MRSLSNPEYVLFLADNPGINLQYPQSEIIAWDGMAILVATSADGGLYTSDVSDAPQLANISLPGYGTTGPQTMLDALPSAIVDTIKQDAADAGALINQAGQALSSAAAAAGKQFQSSILTPLLIGAVIVFGLLYLPRRS